MERRRNILLIMTDQQFADGMSCVIGREHLHTPNMDALAGRGMRFTRAYSPNPLCVPMRTSMMTGKYPHQTQVQTNSDRDRFVSTDHRFMGEVFREAGYETAYFGKWHVPLPRKDKATHGFEIFVEEGELDPAPCSEFLLKRHDRPFLAVASFLSPHEVCEWSRRQPLPGGSIGEPPEVHARPPMRVNSEAPQCESDIMTHMRKSYQAHKLFPVGGYTDEDWRRLIWGYYRLIERADRFVGSVLSALRESGQEENTVVIFVSDHGDCHGAHRWNQKTVFYDESARVPLIISQKGETQKGISDQLVNVGVDLLPTLCDLAGIDRPAGFPGMSLKDVALGNSPYLDRAYVVSQNHMIQCQPVDGKHVTPHGRMVRSDRYKYCLYSEGELRESLVDMYKDPGEMCNLAGQPESAGILCRHRDYLRCFGQEHADSQGLDMLAFVEQNHSDCIITALDQDD
jgi:arylsulfatase A-like enzyme